MSPVRGINWPAVGIVGPDRAERRRLPELGDSLERHSEHRSSVAQGQALDVDELMGGGRRGSPLLSGSGGHLVVGRLDTIIDRRAVVHEFEQASGLGLGALDSNRFSPRSAGPIK